MDLAHLFVNNEVTFNGQLVKVVSVATREDSQTVSIHLELDKGIPMGVNQANVIPDRFPETCYLSADESEVLDPGEGYRLLKVGENVKEGDEITWKQYGDPVFWEKINKPTIDLYPLVEPEDQPCRRKLVDA